jgi:hypothetical protein
MTIVVAKNLASNPFENHWALRDEAAQTLRLTCDL